MQIYVTCIYIRIISYLVEEVCNISIAAFK